MVFSLAIVRLSTMVAVSMALQAVAAEDDRPIVVELEKVNERGDLVLANGDEICLAGISVPVAARRGDRATGWQAAWQRIIEETDVSYQANKPTVHDRYGCPLVTIEDGDGTSLQDMLLSAGWALVDPSSVPKEASVVDAMLALEERARSTGQGIWADKAARPKAAADQDELSALTGTRQLVEGQVRRVSETDRYVYLNFGNDWRTDFTTRLDRKMIERTGFDVTALDGRKLRVRGVLVDSRGPLIDIAHPKQIEFLP